MPSRPNILFITSHDIGQHLGCYGRSTVHTPALDQLAAEGVRFARSFCVAPQCSPSRAAMHTGRYPHSNGVLGLTHGVFDWDLHPEETHLAQRLRAAGYLTGVIGVHHESRRPDRCGFETLAVAEEPGVVVADRCAHFFQSHRQETRPFYLQVGLFEPHRRFDFGGAQPDESRGVLIPPYLREEPSARVELAGFQGAIRQLDHAVGRILGALDAAGLAENTLVLFAADHGIPFPRAKCSLYDPGIEVAFMLRWPRQGWSGGRVVQELISNIDYLPTILDAVGLPVDSAIQGRSFAQLLDGRPYEPRTEIFAEMTFHQYYDPLRCIRAGGFKLICNFASAPSFMNPSQTYRPGTITRIPAVPEYSQHPDLELYDLSSDPHEFTDLSGEPALGGRKNELLARLHGWMKETGDPLLQGPPVSPQHRRVMASLSRAAGGS